MHYTQLCFVSIWKNGDTETLLHLHMCLDFNVGKFDQREDQEHSAKHTHTIYFSLAHNLGDFDKYNHNPKRSKNFSHFLSHTFYFPILLLSCAFEGRLFLIRGSILLSTLYIHQTHSQNIEPHSLVDLFFDKN